LGQIRDIAHQLTIAGRLAARGLGRRFARADAEPATDAAFRATLEPWLAALPPGLVAGHGFHWLPADQPPWFDTGMQIEPGESVTLLADGRVHISRALDLWVGPAFQLWCRVGERGPVFRGTRATHTFVAPESGRLWLASYFPGEWADRSGRLATPASEYSKVSGGLSVLALRWPRRADVPGLFRGFARDTRVPGLVLAEAGRFDQPVPVPEHWDYLWYLGPGEIFRPSFTSDGRPAIGCHTHGDVGILRREARGPLAPGTRLGWSWRVDELPSDLAEDTLPSHDYLSIAVEFDDGQDLTYYWSAALPVGTVYRCPLPAWKDKETHVVVRSGPAGLGAWHDEERDLHADYRRFIGGQAREVVRVWLIANSLLQRGHGRCEYASIRLITHDRTLEVL
jgi:hypothetical protein